MKFLKDYSSPMLELHEFSAADVITASSFDENTDPDQGEWDNTEEVKIW